MQISSYPQDGYSLVMVKTAQEHEDEHGKGWKVVTERVKLWGALGRGNRRASLKRSTVRQVPSERAVCNLGRKHNPARRQGQGWEKPEQKPGFLDTEMAGVGKHSRKEAERDWPMSCTIPFFSVVLSFLVR